MLIQAVLQVITQMFHDIATKKETRLSDRDMSGRSFVGKVCPSSLGDCSPPVWAVWEESGSSHEGLHLLVVVGMTIKPICLPTFSWVWDPCATVHTSSILYPSPGALHAPALRLVRGWQRWGKQKHDLAQAIPPAILGTRNSCRLKLPSPGEDRGEAEWVCQSWAAEGATCG